MITYMDPEEQQLIEVLYVPPNKIDPLLRSDMKIDHDGKIIYRYTVTNQKSSSQPLVGLTLGLVSSIWKPSSQQDLSSLNSNALFIPIGWDGFVIANDININGVSGYRTNWLYGKLDAENDGLQPGQTQVGFGFKSLDIPGVQIAQLDGHGKDAAFPGEPEGDIVDLYDQLMKDTAFVRRFAAVPAVAVPTPFNAATLLGSIQNEMHTWIGMNLLNATFSSQLDRYFQSAINAYNHNQPKAARENIEELHKMLMREHHDLDQENEHADEKDHDKDAKRPLIDRLAARVLDFDLKYVLKRVEEGEDKD